MQYSGVSSTQLFVGHGRRSSTFGNDSGIEALFKRPDIIMYLSGHDLECSVGERLTEDGLLDPKSVRR
ncbi:unnamed protein product [Calypogeia fissa]